MQYATERHQGTDSNRSFYLAMMGVLGGVLLFSRLLEPPRLINVCLFNMLTGLPCMTCGLTRGFHAISLGRLSEALAYHPLSVFLYILTIFHFLVACLRFLGWKFHLVRIPNLTRAMAWGTIGLLFVFWIPRLLVAILHQ